MSAVMSLHLMPRGRPLRLVEIALRASSRASTRSIFKRHYSLNITKYPSSIFKVSEEVSEAVQTGKPVVALETTIYTHGFPYPDNVRLATDLESIVRINGAIPATIGVLNGVSRVGLSNAELVDLASAAGKKETMKVSRRDLPFITGLGMAGKKLNGGTTISGTMILAHMAGIQIFGTGGLGGVHRGGQDTMDVSADLTELGRTPVAVISSGPKAFLDLPRTLEYLETQGVMIGTFADGRMGTVELPAFYSRESGIKSPFIVHNEKEAAAIIHARSLLDIQSGIFFANPIPSEFEIPKAEIDMVIEEAISDAERQGIRGHANTPFILARIKELTKGSSIPANRALIESNVRIASLVAVELARLTASESNSTAMFMPPPPLSADYAIVHPLSPKILPTISCLKETSGPVSILVAGSIAVDLSCDYLPVTTSTTNNSPVAQTSNPAAISQSIGGVGHNVATAAHLTAGPGQVRLCSLVADDLAGKTVLADMERRRMDTTGIIVLPQLSPSQDSPMTPLINRTAQYVAVNRTDKYLHLGMADMSILATPRPFASTWSQSLSNSSPRWLILDANWDAGAIRDWISYTRALDPKSKVAFEPVSNAKATRLFPPIRAASSSFSSSYLFPTPLLDLCTPNIHELASLHTAAKQHGYFEPLEYFSVIDAFGIPSSGARDKFQTLVGAELTDQGVPQMLVQLLPFCPTIITKLGAEGVVMARVLEHDAPELFDAAEARHVISRGDGAKIGGVYVRHFPALPVAAGAIVSVNGAGDTFLGVLVAGLARGLLLDSVLVDVAQRAAVLTLGSSEAVSPDVKGILDGLINIR